MTTLGPGWEHLFLRDARPEEVRRDAESRERKRRGGHTRRAHVCSPPSLDWLEDHNADDAEFQRFVDQLLARE